jgi:hypothetical protein
MLRLLLLCRTALYVSSGLSQEVCGVRRCFAYLTTSLWSYNQSLEVWEPIMEPWQLLLHMDTNPNSQSSAGIAPGSWLRLTSPHGCVHVTLAQAALNSCLDALTDWQAGSEAAADAWTQQHAGKGKTGLATADGLQVYTTFTNTLDAAAYLQLNYGEGRKQVVMLPPHAATPLTQPLPVPPTSHAPLTATQAPPVRLVIDILGGKLLSELAGTGSIPELSVQVSVLVAATAAAGTWVCNQTYGLGRGSHFPSIIQASTCLPQLALAAWLAGPTHVSFQPLIATWDPNA